MIAQSIPLRRCEDCRAVLSRYNPDRVCAPCAVRDRAELARIGRPPGSKDKRPRKVEPSPDEPLGVRLRRLRTSAGLTQQVLADFAGVERQVVARLERSKHLDVKARVIYRLSRALGVSMDSLYAGEGGE